MKSQNKKASLFKMKIREARKEKQAAQANHTFPKALKIDLNVPTIINDQSTNIQTTMDEENIRKQQDNNFLQKLLMSEIKQDELRSVEQQNWKSINKMNAGEILNYQQMLKNQMPSNFIQKLLKKSKKNEKQEMKKQQKMEQEEEEKYKQSETLQKDKQSKDELNSNNKTYLPHPSQMIDQQQQLQQQQNTLKQIFLLNIGINIKTHKITYSDMNMKNVQNISQIKVMLESENNQTQIIAATLLQQILQQIIAIKQEQLPLLKINTFYLHYLQLLKSLEIQIIPSIMYHLKKTKFLSCWYQLALCLLQCIKLLLQGRQKYRVWVITEGKQIIFQKIIQKAFQTIENSSWFKAMNEQHKNIYEEFNALKMWNKKYEENVCKSTIEEINLCEKNNQLVQLLYIEEMIQIETNKKYYTSTISLILNKHPNPLDFIYHLALQLYKKDLKSNRITLNDSKILKQKIYHKISNKQTMFFLPSLQQLQKSKLQQTSKFQKNIFEKLFILKTLNYSQYLRYLQENKQQQIDGNNSKKIENQNLANILTVLNIYQYFSAPHPLSNQQEFQLQIYNIQNTFVYITKLLEGLEKYDDDLLSFFKDYLIILFVDMLAIYASSQSSNFDTEFILSYQKISSSILNQCFVKLCSLLCRLGLQEELLGVISTEQIKMLVEAYNYNSFGNYGFTRLLIFVLVICENLDRKKQIENLILEETVLRYPFLFYHACQDGEYFGIAEIYQKNIQNPNDRKMNIYEILQTANNVNNQHNNYFVKYLLK